MSIVIYSLGVNTQTHTHTYTLHGKDQFLETRYMSACVPGLKIDYFMQAKRF